MRVLVTGGAGFIGSYIVDLLVEKGYTVRILDNLEPQVHKTEPDYVNPEAEFMRGDVTKPEDWARALKGMDAIIHQAAMVGVGQSMYQPVRYLTANTIGTALMYEAIIKMKLKPQKIIVASSMSCYGEGAYRCPEHGKVYPSIRSREQLERGEWELFCPYCSKEVEPIPTDEEKPQHNLSTYALSKYDQERLTMNYGFALKIPSVALRYFNVYGPRQSLNNPYTGVAAIFSSRIKNNNQPIIYEDGNQSRDFIYVEDVARANLLALESDVSGYYNVGTGNPITIKGVAETLIKLYGKSLEPKVTGEFRPGDVRHCFADITKIKKELGFKPKVSVEEGFRKLVEWGEKVEAEDRFEEASKELKSFMGE
ncbi:MAG: nucleoside-diphosphate sugar epimerase [Candidatus Aenigmatarchaeota archaeon]|nr:MAG: nucleoside-diphosphate sugar epimerase [Candidatus Aenigmarchaeota archaeon]